MPRTEPRCQYRHRLARGVINTALSGKNGTVTAGYSPERIFNDFLVKQNFLIHLRWIKMVYQRPLFTDQRIVTAYGHNAFLPLFINHGLPASRTSASIVWCVPRVLLFGDETERPLITLPAASFRNFCNQPTPQSSRPGYVLGSDSAA